MRIAIVDDEEKERSRLRDYVDKFFDEKTLGHECVEFSSCLNFVSDYVEPFDIILLDIEMPHMDGMTGAKKIREIDSRAVIIFITHMVQYAVKGYEVDALDFMVKPVTQFNLEVKLNKALKRLPQRKTVDLFLPLGGRVVLSEDEIRYVEGSNQYVIYHTGKGETYKVHSSLKAEEQKLGKNFSRCSNSFIVNMGCVTKAVGSDVYVGEEALPMSRSRKKSFLEELNRFLGGL